VGELTDLLARANSGDEAARQALFAAAYGELRVLAHSRLRDVAHNTLLDTTALVHESFVRFVQAGRLQGSDRGHFFAYAATVMRSVIVDFARRRQAQRRGGGATHVTLDDELVESIAADEDQVMGVNEALRKLEASDPRMVKVVEMRFFAGMRDEEIGEALGISLRTVRREWERARLVLAAALGR